MNLDVLDDFMRGYGGRLVFLYHFIQLSPDCFFIYTGRRGVRHRLMLLLPLDEERKLSLHQQETAR